jgi:acyl dehydratase
MSRKIEGDEMAGLWFEGFSIGQTFDHEIRRTVTEADNMWFSNATYNPAAIHIDAEYCKGTEFGKPLVNSIFTLGLVIGLSVQDTTLGTTVANLGMSDTRFPKPVFAGDTIRSRTSVADLRESKSRPNAGIVTFVHRGLNQHGDEVCVCTRQALMLRRPH